MKSIECWLKLLVHFGFYCMKNSFSINFSYRQKKAADGKIKARKEMIIRCYVTRSGVPLSLYSSDDVMMP